MARGLRRCVGALCPHLAVVSQRGRIHGARCCGGTGLRHALSRRCDHQGGSAVSCTSDPARRQAMVGATAAVIPVHPCRWEPREGSDRAGSDGSDCLVDHQCVRRCPGSDLRGIRSDGAVSFGKLLLRNHWHRNHICSTFVPDMNRVG